MAELANALFRTALTCSNLGQVLQGCIQLAVFGFQVELQLR